MREFEFHPIANAFPMMDADELEALGEDIKKHGIRQPIVVHEDMILDGRNRYTAAREAGVKVSTFDTYEGDDPVGFVCSANLMRRHLTPGQKAMAAEKLASMPTHRPKISPPIGGLLDGHQEDKPLISQADAAAKVGTNARAVQRARAVRRKAAPEVVKAVEDGAMTLNAAERTISKPKTNKPITPRPTTAKPHAAALARDTRNVDDLDESLRLFSEIVLPIYRSADGLVRDRIKKEIARLFADVERQAA